MSRVLVNQHLRFLEWDVDATAAVIKSLDAVPKENRGSENYQKAITILAHLLVARQMWLFRLGKFPTKPASFFPTDLDLAHLETGFAEIFTGYRQMISGMDDDAAFNRKLEYQSSDAGKFRSSLGDILAQLTGHGSYHRGQIATLVKSLGGTPAITDFIYWSRESV